MNKFWYLYGELFYKHVFYLAFKLCPGGGIKRLRKTLLDKIIDWCDKHIVHYDQNRCSNCGKYIKNIYDELYKSMKQNNLSYDFRLCPRCKDKIEVTMKHIN
jgi:hypothetical protein